MPTGRNAMTETAVVLLSHRGRLAEIVRVLARYGLAEIFDEGALEAMVAGRPRVPMTFLADWLTAKVDPDVAQMTPGERICGALGELGTTWVKLGQMLSVRPDIVGQTIAAALATLQSGVPPDDPDVALARVEEALGGRVEDIFASYTTTAFASGSVAQVHEAVLADGRAVMVKVVHADAVERSREDLAIMHALARQGEQDDPNLARYRPTQLIAEFDTMLTRALDLRGEAQNLRLFGRLLAAEPDVVLPETIDSLTGAQVLTMTRIDGRHMSDRASVEAAGWEVDALVRRATDLYLDMIFRYGVFHADPHPGNFLLPGQGRLAILDFGDVGRLSPTRRNQLEELVLAIGGHDLEFLVDTVLEMTNPPPGTDLKELRSTVSAWADQYLLAAVGSLDLAEIVSTVMSLMHDHHLSLPADLALLFRVLTELQGMGAELGITLNIEELLAPHLTRTVQDRLSPRRLARRTLRSAHRWSALLDTLPDDLTSLLASVRAGKVSVDLNIHDVDRVTDRLVDAGIAAASILASAQLVSRSTGPTVAGMSVPGLLAAGVGALTWRRLALQRRRRRPLSAKVRDAVSVARAR